MTNATYTTEPDPRYDEAVRLVTETRRGSVAHLMRMLKIGFFRADALFARMEASGIVGPVEDDGTREVLVPLPEGEQAWLDTLEVFAAAAATFDAEPREEGDCGAAGGPDAWLDDLAEQDGTEAAVPPVLH